MRRPQQNRADYFLSLMAFLYFKRGNSAIRDVNSKIAPLQAVSGDRGTEALMDMGVSAGTFLMGGMMDGFGSGKQSIWSYLGGKAMDMGKYGLYQSGAFGSGLQNKYAGQNTFDLAGGLSFSFNIGGQDGAYGTSLGLNFMTTGMSFGENIGGLSMHSGMFQMNGFKQRQVERQRRAMERQQQQNSGSDSKEQPPVAMDLSDSRKREDMRKQLEIAYPNRSKEEIEAVLDGMHENFSHGEENKQTGNSMLATLDAVNKMKEYLGLGETGSNELKGEMYAAFSAGGQEGLDTYIAGKKDEVQTMGKQIVRIKTDDLFAKAYGGAEAKTPQQIEDWLTIRAAYQNGNGDVVAEKIARRVMFEQQVVAGLGSYGTLPMGNAKGTNQAGFDANMAKGDIDRERARENKLTTYDGPYAVMSQDTRTPAEQQKVIQDHNDRREEENRREHPSEYDMFGNRKVTKERDTYLMLGTQESGSAGFGGVAFSQGFIQNINTGEYHKYRSYAGGGTIGAGTGGIFGGSAGFEFGVIKGDRDKGFQSVAGGFFEGGASVGAGGGIEFNRIWSPTASGWTVSVGAYSGGDVHGRGGYTEMHDSYPVRDTIMEWVGWQTDWLTKHQKLFGY